MITGTSTQFAALVSGTDVVGAWRVQMTLPAGPYSDVTLAVESLEIDASTTSDMPTDTRIQVGYPAAAASVTLSGQVDQSDETLTAGWLFSPYNTASPLYQKDALYVPVTIDLGLYTDAAAGTSTQGTPEYVRKFTGYVDDYTVNDDGSVTFSCIESMQSQLRGKAQIPPLLNAPVTPEYLIDYMVRGQTAARVSSWPPQIHECILAVGLRTATAPEAATLYQDYSPTYAPGVFGSGVAGGALAFNPEALAGGPNASQAVFAEYFLSPPYVLGGATFGTPAQPTSPNVYAEFWINGDVSTVFPSLVIGKMPSGNLGAGWSTNYFKLTVKGTGLEVSSTLFATQTWSTTVSPGAHYIGWWMKSNTTAGTLDITVMLDGTTHVFTQLAVNIGSAARNYVAVGWSGTSPASTIEALQVSHNTSGYLAGVGNLLSSYPFTPKAVLDPSLNSVQVLNEIDGDTYSVIQQLADAELAVAGGDEAGIFRFYNRNTLRSAASVRTVTSATSLAGLGGIQTAASSVVNHARIDWAGWQLSTTASVVFQATDAIKVPAGKTITLTPTLDSPAVLYGSVTTALFTTLADGATGPGFFLRASRTKGGNVTTGIAGSVQQIAANKLQITLTNRTTSDAWLVSSTDYLDLPAGTPLLTISGYTWTQTSGTADVQYPSVNADGSGGAVSSRFGDQPYALSGNPFIQDDGVAFQLATDIVVDLCNPRPNLTGVDIVPDPRLQLTDVIRLADPDRTSIDEYARIFAWRIAWDASGTYSMTIDARTLAPPGGWIMGVAGRSEIGSTAYVYSSV